MALPTADNRVLIVSPMPTHRTHSGNRARLLSFIQEFQRRNYRVDLIWYAIENGGSISESDYDTMSEAVDRLFVVAPSDPLIGSRQKLDHIDMLRDANLERQTRWCVSNFDYYLVVANYVFLSYLSDSVGSIPFVIDTHDVLGGRDQKLKRLSKKAEFYDLAVDEEKKGLSRADVVIAITDQDRSTFQGYGLGAVALIGHAPVNSVIKHTVSLEPRCEHAVNNKLYIGVLGSDHGAVLDGLETLCAAIDQAGIGEQVLISVAGLVCKNLKERPYVKKHGFVADLKTFFDSVDLIIIPVDYGSGLKIKMVEVLTYNKPVLATAHASIGLNPVLEEHCVENSASLVFWIIKYIKKPVLLDDLLSASVSLGERYLQTVSSQFDALIDMVSEKSKYLSIGLSETTIEINSIMTLGPLGVMGAGAGLLQILNRFPEANIAFVMDNIKKEAEGIDCLVIRPEEASQYQKDLPVLNMVCGPVGCDVYEQLKRLGFSRILTVKVPE